MDEEFFMKKPHQKASFRRKRVAKNMNWQSRRKSTVIRRDKSGRVIHPDTPRKESSS